MKNNNDSKRWNLFARELEVLLSKRGLRLGHLNDRAGIHPQKVSRLQHSLIEPRFNVLSPEDLEIVSDVFDFTEIEALSLQAAILATAIEEILMGRIDNDNALLAAEQIFPIIQEALHTHSGTSRGLGVIKDINTLILRGKNMETSLDRALEILDKATISLNLANIMKSPTQKTDQARQARGYFTLALESLENLSLAVGDRESWEMWCNEAIKGIGSADEVILLYSH